MEYKSYEELARTLHPDLADKKLVGKEQFWKWLASYVEKKKKN